MAFVKPLQTFSWSALEQEIMKCAYSGQSQFTYNIGRIYINTYKISSSDNTELIEFFCLMIKYGLKYKFLKELHGKSHKQFRYSIAVNIYFPSNKTLDCLAQNKYFESISMSQSQLIINKINFLMQVAHNNGKSSISIPLYNKRAVNDEIKPHTILKENAALCKLIYDTSNNSSVTLTKSLIDCNKYAKGYIIEIFF